MALSPEERILISRAVKRDREAFAKLYVQYHEAVLRRILMIVKRRDEAEDIAGEAFLRAWNAVDRFEDRDVSILAWLCKIAERRAYEHMRKSRPAFGLDQISEQASLDDGPEETAERQADAAEVRRALTKLPVVQRQVISQRFLQHLSYDAIGATLGKPVGTVRVIQHRALIAIRLIMKEERLKQEGAAPTGISK
jgi:RNA polymerase sigma-70 factor (ECF subfamily)